MHVQRAKTYLQLAKYEAALCECKYVLRRTSSWQEKTEMYNVDIKCIESGYPLMAAYIVTAHSILSNGVDRQKLCTTALEQYRVDSGPLCRVSHLPDAGGPHARATNQ